MLHMFVVFAYSLAQILVDQTEIARINDLSWCDFVGVVCTMSPQNHET